MQISECIFLLIGNVNIKILRMIYFQLEYRNGIVDLID